MTRFKMRPFPRRHVCCDVDARAHENRWVAKRRTMFIRRGLLATAHLQIHSLRNLISLKNDRIFELEDEVERLRGDERRDERGRKLDDPTILALARDVVATSKKAIPVDEDGWEPPASVFGVFNNIFIPPPCNKLKDVQFGNTVQVPKHVCIYNVKSCNRHTVTDVRPKEC